MAAPETYFLRGHDLAEISVPGVRVERRPACEPSGKAAAGHSRIMALMLTR